MNIYRTDVAILVSKEADYERIVMRYSGLVEALAALSATCFFARGHASYNSKLQVFENVFDLQLGSEESVADAGMAPVIRDLTLSVRDQPIYSSPVPTRLIPHPVANRFLASKANMVTAAPRIHPATVQVSADHIAEAIALPGERFVLKPVTGMRSHGVQVLSRSELTTVVVTEGEYLIQEFIDTSRGIPELGVRGTHNIRVISIDSQVVGAIARVGGSEPDMLRNGIYGNFIGSTDLPDTMQAIIAAVHEVLAAQAGAGQNIIAIDMMRGMNAQGEQVDVLCEVNRRPLRISPHMILDKHKHLDNDGILHLGRLWDRAEAALLMRQAGKT